MNNYPSSPNEYRRVPSKKVAMAASGLLLAVACQAQPESPPEAPYCTMSAAIPPAKTIPATYADGIKQILSSLAGAPKEHVAPGRSTTKAGLYVSNFKLTVNGTAESPRDKDVHVSVESTAPQPTFDTMRAISTYVLGRTVDDRRFTYSEQNIYHSDAGWTFTTEHLTSYKNLENLETAWFTAQPNGYTCAYVEKKTLGHESTSSPHVVRNTKDAEAIGNVTVASLLRNAGAIEHETPGFLDNQTLPAVSAEFWSDMNVTDPPLGPVQPVR